MALFPVPVEYRIVRNVQSVRTYVTELAQSNTPYVISAVRTGAGITEWFKVGRGVRQGCILSPSLYNLYAEDIMRTALEEKVWGVKVGGVRRSNLR